MVVCEVGRAPPRFKRIFIVRFTPTSASPSPVPLRPHPGGSVCARGAAPPSAPRTVPVCCSPSVIPLTRPSLVTPPYLSLTPCTCTQTRGSGPKWEYAADSALTAALIYLHCSAPPPPFPFTFPCLTLSPSLLANPLHSRSAILEHRGGESRYAPKSSVLSPSVDDEGSSPDNMQV